MEKKIIQAAVQNREACHKLSLLLTHEDFSEIGAELFRRINKYYQTDIDAQEVDITLFKSILHEEMPKQADILVQVLDNLEKTSIPNLLQEVTKLKKKALANSIIQSLARDAESLDAVAFMDKYRDLEQIKDEQIQAVSEYAKDVLTELSDTSNLVQIYPVCINDAIDGGVIPGSHILVFARPNVGKTMTVINLGAMMAKDGRKVLHLINEEPKKQILQRYISRLSGRVKRAIFQDIDAAIALAESRGLNNIFIEDINPGTFHEIRGLIERIKPDVVIIDQLRNIDMRTDSKVEQLEKAATAARNIAKHYDIVVVSVTQAGDSASGKLVLTDSDIDNSKTGIPGQCDLIIGVGCDDTQRRSSMRTMTIVKNKITSVHDYYAVRVEEDLSRIIQI